MATKVTAKKLTALFKPLGGWDEFAKQIKVLISNTWLEEKWYHISFAKDINGIIKLEIRKWSEDLYNISFVETNLEYYTYGLIGNSRLVELLNSKLELNLKAESVPTIKESKKKCPQNTLDLVNSLKAHPAQVVAEWIFKNLGGFERFTQQIPIESIDLQSGYILIKFTEPINKFDCLYITIKDDGTYWLRLDIFDARTGFMPVEFEHAYQAGEYLSKKLSIYTIDIPIPEKEELIIKAEMDKIVNILFPICELNTLYATGLLIETIRLMDGNVKIKLDHSQIEWFAISSVNGLYGVYIKRFDGRNITFKGTPAEIVPFLNQELNITLPIKKESRRKQILRRLKELTDLKLRVVTELDNLKLELYEIDHP